MKFPKLNQKGITHIIAPIAFIAVFAAVGSVVLLKGHALTYTYIDGLTLKNGSRVSSVHVPIYNITTGASGGTISDSIGQYHFKNVVVGYKYTLQAYKAVNCTEYYSNPVTITAKYNNGSGNTLNFALNNTKKLC